MSVLSPRAGADRLEHEVAPRRGGDPSLPTPCVRLFTDRLLVDVADGFSARYEEVESPVLSLSFDYGGAVVRSSDPCARAFSTRDLVAIERDRASEAQARYLLESFGAVELACVEDCATVPGSDADYLVRIDGDVHAVCSFSAYAVPQLRALGWRVEIDESYKWQVIDTEALWYANLDEERDESEGSDWFSLELGVELDGQRINLLPAFLDLLEQSRAQSLGGLARSSWRGCVALPVGENCYLPVPGERLRVVMQVLMELYQGAHAERERIVFPAVQAASLAQLGDAFASEDSLRWEGDTTIRDRGVSLASGPAPISIEPPRGLQATLRPYQHTGLAFLQHLRTNGAGGILADDMGLGKTLQTIAHIVAEKESGRMDRPSLIITPTSLVGNWQRELERFAPMLDVLVLYGPKRHRQLDRVAEADVVITTYPLVARDLEHLVDRDFYLLILDEAQTIKNSRSRAHRAVKQLQAEHPLCLTGTPVENNLDELWSLFDFAMPGLLGDAERFRAQFANPIEREGAEGRLEALRERVHPFILRRRKEEVARDLPSKTEIVRPVDLVGGQRDLYESIRVAAHARVRSVIREKGIAASTIAILDALMKLRQVCCDPGLVDVKSAREVEESAKYEMLFELLPTLLAQGRRVLLFSQFTSMLALIAQGLTENDIAHVSLTGSTRDRQKPIDAFQGGDADVFLISLKAGGTGLNLTSADTVIHYDPWWNPAAQAQATDRAYRIGQKKPVFVYNLIVAGSVEEQMLKLQRRKRHLADSILERTGGGGLDLSQDDVDHLFAPLG